MILKKVKLHNWKNFQNCEVDLTERCFIIGANASGKSNFIDALRFLRDISKQSGGLQSAVEERGGITKIRCLSARIQTNVSITVELGNSNEENLWRYHLDFAHTGGGVFKNQVKIIAEEVYSYRESKNILERNGKSEGEDEYPEYNSCILPFIQTAWNIDNARQNTDSLNKMIIQLQNLIQKK